MLALIPSGWRRDGAVAAASDGCHLTFSSAAYRWGALETRVFTSVSAACVHLCFRALVWMMHAILRYRALRRGLWALWEHFKVREDRARSPCHPAFTICAPPPLLSLLTALRATEQQQLFWATTTTLMLSNSQSTSRATCWPIALERRACVQNLSSAARLWLQRGLVFWGGGHSFIFVDSLRLFQPSRVCNQGDGGSFY